MFAFGSIKFFEGEPEKKIHLMQTSGKSMYYIVLLIFLFAIHTYTNKHV